MKLFIVCALLLFSPLSNAYTVNQGHIVDEFGDTILLNGVNWFGAEGSSHIPHGLWKRSYKDMIMQIKNLGFTAVRLPFCPETLDGVGTGSISSSLNPDLVGLNSLQVLDAIMVELNNQGLYILLDHHRPDCATISELWYTSTYAESDWLNDLAFVADRYRDLPYFIGIDLKNEPHGAATWGSGNLATDWNLAAERAAQSVLAVNPNLVIFVEGVQSNKYCIDAGYGHWWGGSLEGQSCTPLNIDTTKLVFSPHVYGPDVYAQTYFSDPSFPDNMSAIWDAHFGYLAMAGRAVMPGEFGGKYGHGGDPNDVIWQDAFVDYLIARGMTDSFYWSWNPNSTDTGGILQDDWITVWDDKAALLARLMDAAVLPYCGDGVLNQTSELCDDANQLSGDGCTSVCAVEFCGDGILNNTGIETCDDGNTIDNDGCSATCTLENKPPVALAGADKTYTGKPLKKSKVTLNGSTSYDPEGLALTFSWKVVSVPIGSTITTSKLYLANTSRPYFYPDARGSFVLSLTVTDPQGAFASDTVVVVF